ncbi:MAG: hypothetical protein JSU68_12715 [Phycisphaerales bacterium]|nr:MAG: hypothetical protein JSU68_12715 [Phycisphaerales bacterium]
MATPMQTSDREVDLKATGSAACAKRRALSWSPLLLVFLLGAGLRCGWVAGQTGWRDGPESLAFADERDYWSMAASFAAGQTMVDQDGLAAARMPGYPLFLSVWLHSASPVLFAKLAQAVLGGVGCVVCALIASRVGGPVLAWIAGLLAALDPFAILFANLLLSETLFTTVLALFMFATITLWERADTPPAHRAAGPKKSSLWRWALWGASFLVCTYLHPSVVLLLPLAGLLLVLRHRTWSHLGGFAVALIIVVIGLAPWSLRNHRVLGGRCLLSSRLGISLYDGVGPKADGRSDLAYTRQIADVRGLDELGKNRWFLQRSLEHIRAEPGRILRLAGRKLLLTWNVVPNLEAHRSAAEMLVSAAWMVPALILGVAGLLAPGPSRSTCALLLLPVAYFTLLHMLFVGSVRYRTPVMPYVEVLAAVGLLLVARSIRPRTGRPSVW